LGVIAKVLRSTRRWHCWRRAARQSASRETLRAAVAPKCGWSMAREFATGCDRWRRHASCDKSDKSDKSRRAAVRSLMSRLHCCPTPVKTTPRRGTDCEHLGGAALPAQKNIARFRCAMRSNAVAQTTIVGLCTLPPASIACLNRGAASLGRLTRGARQRPPAADKRPNKLRAALVESRMGAVAWAMRQRSVSHPRSSNRTCGFPASGSPTDFTVRHTARATKVGVRGVTPRVPHRPRWRRTGVCYAPSSCAVARGNRAHAHRRSSRYPGKPAGAQKTALLYTRFAKRRANQISG
jgi:hypothetical protein